jgi:hypothetical protein
LPAVNFEKSVRIIHLYIALLQQIVFLSITQVPERMNGVQIGSVVCTVPGTSLFIGGVHTVGLLRADPQTLDVSGLCTLQIHITTCVHSPDKQMS